MTIKPIKLFTSTAAVLTLAAATAFAADASFDRTLNVSGAPNVSVSTGSGTFISTPALPTRFTSWPIFTQATAG